MATKGWKSLKSLKGCPLGDSALLAGCRLSMSCVLLIGSGSLYPGYFVPVLLAAVAFCCAGKDIVLFLNCRGSWWLAKKGTDALRFNAFSGPRRDAGSASTDFQKELPPYACSAVSVLRTTSPAPVPLRPA